MDTNRDTVVRGLHDLGLAGWFGGTLAGAVALNGAAAKVPDAKLRSEVANEGWRRWTPVNLVFILMHLYGGFELLRRNRDRVQGQEGVGVSTKVKLVLTILALGLTGYSRMVGQKMMQEPQPVEGITEPGSTTDGKYASLQRQQRLLQWLIPAAVGGTVVMGSLHGEQQKPDQVVSNWKFGDLKLAESLRALRK